MGVSAFELILKVGTGVSLKLAYRISHVKHSYPALVLLNVEIYDERGN